MGDSMCFKTAWGWIGIVVTELGVAQILLGGKDRRAVERTLPARRTETGRTSAGPARLMLREAQTQIHDYLRGKRRDFTVPVDLSAGTAFQRRVWRAITRIPYGRVRSYQWVAARVGGKRYARAVGMALGANPVPLVIPCHRIVAHDGSLGGFSCGLPVKRRLLQLEGSLALLRHR